MDYISEAWGMLHQTMQSLKYTLSITLSIYRCRTTQKLLNLGETSERDALLAKLANMSTEELAKLFA